MVRGWGVCCECAPQSNYEKSSVSSRELNDAAQELFCLGWIFRVDFGSFAIAFLHPRSD